MLWVSHPSGLGYRRTGTISSSGSGGGTTTIPGNAPVLDSGTSDGSDQEELTRLANFDTGANENPNVSQAAPTSRAVQSTTGAVNAAAAANGGGAPNAAAGGNGNGPGGGNSGGRTVNAAYGAGGSGERDVLDEIMNANGGGTWTPRLNPLFNPQYWNGSGVGAGNSDAASPWNGLGSGDSASGAPIGYGYPGGSLGGPQPTVAPAPANNQTPASRQVDAGTMLGLLAAMTTMVQQPPAQGQTGGDWRDMNLNDLLAPNQLPLALGGSVQVNQTAPDTLTQDSEVAKAFAAWAVTNTLTQDGLGMTRLPNDDLWLESNRNPDPRSVSVWDGRDQVLALPGTWIEYRHPGPGQLPLIPPRYVYIPSEREQAGGRGALRTFEALGWALGAVVDPSHATTVFQGYQALHALDVAFAEFRFAYDGKPHDTLQAYTIGTAAQYLGASPETARTIGRSSDVGADVAGFVFSIWSLLGRPGQAARAGSKLDGALNVGDDTLPRISADAEVIPPASGAAPKAGQSELGNALSNLGRNPGVDNINTLEEFGPGAGFSGVYDVESGKWLAYASGDTNLLDGTIPNNLVPQAQGHRIVNEALSQILGNTSNNRIGFSMTM